MHFSLRQLWRVILYHVKNCKWLCQSELGWADVGMKHRRENSAQLMQRAPVGAC